MTEKQYGGATGRETKTAKIQINQKPIAKKQDKPIQTEKSLHKLENYDNYIKAGKIASEVVKYAKSIIKKGVPLLEIADKIESKINELGGKPAFPVNLSINEIAAHSTPAFNDATSASGLLKVDIGVHVQGAIADTAFSIDLENNEKNKKLIDASEKALKKAIEAIKEKAHLNKIGAEIDNAIKSMGFVTIHNLSGHSLDEYNIHAGITIPNFDNSQAAEIPEGVYAIEPFATAGLGRVKDGKPSGIYKVEKIGNVRDNFAREVLDYIADNYQTLPFCSRWIYKQFSTRGLLALKRIEDAGLLHHYPQLVEESKAPVSQAEHTIIIEKGKKIITTE